MFKMSLEVKILLIVSFILNVTSFASARCFLHISDNPALRPKTWLTVGTRQVDLTLRNDAKVLTVFENQKITLHCKSKFRNFEYLDHKNKLELTCERDRLCETDGICYSQDVFECSSQQWNLYESQKSFVWCPSSMSSFIIARPTDSENKYFQYLAAVCYDIKNLVIKSIFYTIASPSSPLLAPTTLADVYKPGTELEHVGGTFATKYVLERDYSHQATQNYVQFAQYNYSSIIQNALLSPEYGDQFGSLLDVVWWPNLRLGNWKRYETALKKLLESEEKAFDIIAGVSAVAAAPVTQICETHFTLTDLVDNTSGRIPLYVWNYLRSKTNSSEDIVIVGVNSPFYQFYSESDLIFCKDKCNEVPWLQKAVSTFRYSALGVVFCCSTKDVKSSKRLDGFPEINITKPK